MAGINPTFVHLSDIYWSSEDNDYMLNVKGHGFQTLSCPEDIPYDILIDQAFRNLYFGYGFNVIYSRYFFRDEEASSKFCRGYKLIGFFRGKKPA